MSTYLLEIGTEELPAKFAETIVNQFKSLIEFDLNKNFIKYEKVFCSSTPRRIVLMIFGIIDKGEDKIEFRKGPKAESAFNNGSPTNAAKGFAKSLNISIEDLQIKNTDKGDFVFGEKIEKGQLAKDLLSIIVPKVLKSLQGQRFMKWGFGNFKFSRPIRWIVSLYNSDLLDFSLKDIDNDLEIGNISRGHRLFKNKISIIHPDSYISLLEDSGVIVKRDVRKEFILNQIENTSNKLTLYPPPDGRLVDRFFVKFTIETDAWEDEADKQTGADGINNINSIPFDNMPYQNINAIGKHWIRRYALSLCKEMLGQIRGKFGGNIPIPGDNVTLNSGDLLSQAAAEKTALITELKTILEETTYLQLMKNDAELLDANGKILEETPSPIFVG